MQGMGRDGMKSGHRVVQTMSYRFYCMT
jgi:hypothetical protein